MARYRPDQTVRLEDSRPLAQRFTRSPQHTMHVWLQPWQQVPCLIAPVMAGETLKNALIQVRVMSDPVASKTQGWWLEFYLFYVRVGDLDSADVVRAAIVDPAQNMTSINAGGAAHYYHFTGNRPCWALECHKVVSRGYFRKEGENWNDFMIGLYPAVQVAGRTLMDSIHTDAELGAPTDSDLWLKQWNAFQAARSAKLTTATWGEYLAKQGVRVPPQLTEPVQDYRIPELVRFVRDFAYPVPTVDNTTGAIRSTVQWSLAERVDKRRYFAEPGFLFGLLVVRPKVYFGNQQTNGTDSLLYDAQGFMPPDFDEDPHTAMVVQNGGTADSGGILTGNAALPTYWMDRRDLYLYGDQWVSNGQNVWPPVMTGDTGTFVSLPATTLANKKYPSASDAQNMFVTTDGTQKFIGDGICTLRIASRLGSADVTN